ncbi:S8 family peptidase [Planosporangium thailandense]|uniref:S8 family peptidase n=1 Tax=Planosporangium thailandense TaxID=765197 RepID=A0ABX0XU70_9ACTN|nr:S8 family peptidase [Planosporangium thailandense]NJC68783.1 S8 family peptidase [Planosporangium thailandense]
MRLPESTRPGRRASEPGRWVALLGLATAAATVATVAVSGPASAAVLADGVVRDAGTTRVVPGSYVVVLKDTVTRTRGVDAPVHDLLGRFGGKLGHTYHSALHGYAVRSMSEVQARRLAADPSVAYVQKDGVFTISDTQTGATWGLDRIDQRNLPLDGNYTYPTTASNVHAYIIDTGIRVTHSEFGGRATPGFDAVTSGGNANDCHGHGTHVSGTVGGKTYGVAKGVQLVAVRVLDCNGSGSTSGVAAGIDWVTANAIKPAVANMSLGGGADATLDAAVQRSIASGVTYGIAAGNGDIFGNPQDACGTSPARVPEAITVAATQNNDQRASFSNYGTCVDIFAPGVSITSSWNSSDTATNTISGTSMATPHVVGAAALVAAANPGFTPQQVRDALVNNATSGVVGNPGTGSPNKLLYVGNGGTPPPPPPPPPAGCSGTNGTDVPVPDAGAAVTSPITISGCDRNASASAKVEVHIKHTYRGDLRIDLVAPDSTSSRLKTEGFDSAANVDTTYTVNLSGKAANGTWKLKVQDMYRMDTGYIDSWTLTV